MNPNDNQYQELQNEFVEKLQKRQIRPSKKYFQQSEKDKWNFINKA